MDKVRFSMKEIISQETKSTNNVIKKDKVTKTKSTTKSNSKYTTKIVDGVKYMILN